MGYLRGPYILCFWVEQRKRDPSSGWCFACFVWRPETRLLHILKLEAFISLRIKRITCFSVRPNWYSIASKGVRSSQAISITRLICSVSREGIFISLNKGRTYSHCASPCDEFHVRFSTTLELIAGSICHIRNNRLKSRAHYANMGCADSHTSLCWFSFGLKTLP